MTSHATDNLADEAHAFDRQIDERIRNGHVPDLRLCPPCDWFYNNSWRRPAYVQLDFGEQFALIRDSLRQHAPGGARSRVLEVGCGPGYMSLELARAGFEVIGVDVSQKCIDVARDVAARDPFAAERGALRYVVGDFFTHPDLASDSFDGVIFVGALHHFAAQEQVLRRARNLLKNGGLLIAHEPVRDRVTPGNALFVHLLRVLLSAQGKFFKDYPVPADRASWQADVDKLFNEMRYELEDGSKMQSVNDNEAGYAEMYPVLSSLFSQVSFDWRYAFFHEFIGGLRFEEATNEALARYLRDMDGALCKAGVLSATEFYFVGRKAEGEAR
jgi:SAM-dependent methyltransferase